MLATKLLVPSVMFVAAACEVGGDAMIRAGLRSRGLLWCAIGALVLAAYGIIVNLIPMDFSKLLGVYVAFFAVVSVGFGRLVFGESPPPTTWIGLAIIVLGSALVQFGATR